MIGLFSFRRGIILWGWWRGRGIWSKGRFKKKVIWRVEGGDGGGRVLWGCGDYCSGIGVGFVG